MIRRGFFPDQTASTQVQVTVAGKAAIVHQVPMMTPGDVIGIPARQIIRCAPANGIVNAEPNYLASVDFDAPDLPWLFSRKPASGPVLPWITLAVVDLTDLQADPLSASPVGSQLTIAAAQLPNPAESWMWAHGQMLDTDTVPGDPSRSLSRLICSRKLEPNRRYLACVVPVFAGGKAAGLGIDPGDARTSMGFAWDPAGGDVTLPAYYAWRFATGPDGDFESLVRQLHGEPLPPGLGTRRLWLSYPMSGLPEPASSGTALELQVALRPPGSTLDDVQPLVGTSYLDALRSRLVDAGYDVSLLTAKAGSPPAVGPPVYGQLAVGETATAANLNTSAPPWLRSINLDPRLRIAAGLGSEVARQSRDRYLEEAWRQVGDVLGANGVRRRVQFALAASASLHRKWISQISAADLVTSTAPVHARVFVGTNLTITGRLRQSPLPPSIASVEFRRMTRVRGRLPTAAALQTSAGPAVLASLAAQARPLDAAVAVDTIDVLNPPSKVWGVAAAPLILARLDASIDQTGMTAAEAAARLELDEPTGDDHLRISRPGVDHRGGRGHRYRAQRRGPAAGRARSSCRDREDDGGPLQQGHPVGLRGGAAGEDDHDAGAARRRYRARPTNSFPAAGADRKATEAADDRRRQNHRHPTDRRLGCRDLAANRAGRRLRPASSGHSQRTRSGGDDAVPGQPSHHRTHGHTVLEPERHHGGARPVGADLPGACHHFS